MQIYTCLGPNKLSREIKILGKDLQHRESLQIVELEDKDCINSIENILPV